MKRLLLATLSAGFLLQNLAGQPIITNEFTADEEGWRVADLWEVDWTIVNGYPCGWLAASGNPGGCASSVDPSGWNYHFQAPAAYLGDKSAYAGGVLQYDIRNDQSNCGGFTSWGVFLFGPGDPGNSSTPRLRRPIPRPISAGYTTISISLEPDGWQVYPGVPATQAEFDAVLSSLSQLLIGADYGNADRSFLDNVRLVPPGGDNLRSEFDASAEGWVVAQLDDSTWMPCTFQGPMWNAAGGSGGGCIEHFDLCNLPCGGTAHFAAPRRFLGDKSAFAGGLVRWDLRDPTEGGGASSWGLILIGGGMAIRGAAGRPSAAWSSFGVRLEAESFEHPDARVVTAPEFAAVLSSLEFVLVSADWGSHANNPSLDNFCFVPPLPSSGDGCPAVAGPRIEYSRVSPHPGIGSTPVIELSNLPLDAFFAATLIGLQPIDVPIDPGNAPGCSLLVGSVMDTVAMSLTPPNAALPLPIPDDTRYVGASVLLQGAALARSANALGVVVSQRATMTIGR